MRLPKVALVALLCLPLLGQGYNIPFNPQPSAGGSNYLTDTNTISCWFMTDTDASDGISDEVTGHTVHNLTLVSTEPTMSTSSTVPSTSYSHVEGNTAGYFTTADSTDFESSDFTITYWQKRDNNSLNYGLHKLESNKGWLYFKLADDARDFRVYDDSGSTWRFYAARYNDTETGGDLVANEIALFRSGADDCAGGCNVADGMDMAAAQALTIMADGGGSTPLQAGGFYAELCYHKVALLETALCEICTFGIDGTVASRRVAECGSCTLP